MTATERSDRHDDRRGPRSLGEHAEHLIRYVTRHLWSSPRRSLHDVIGTQLRSFERATLAVRVFYAAGLVWVVLEMGSWPSLLAVDRAQPQWPAAWLAHVDLRTGIRIILTAHVVAALTALVVPQRRWARVAYSAALLEYLALIYGFGKTNHNFHAWFFVSVVLIFLPTGGWHSPKRAADRHYFLTVIWSCQLVVLFTYTLTGLWKLGYAAHDLFGARTSSFEINGFALIVAKRLLDTNQRTVMGEFFVRNPWVGWALYNGTMYLEVTSLIIAFRPRLYRAWGFGLLLFHLGTQLAMGFTFTQNIFLVSLLFICAPAAPDSVPIKDAVLDLPGIHFVSRRLRRPRLPKGVALPARAASAPSSVS